MLLSINVIRTAKRWYVQRGSEAFPVDAELPTTAELLMNGLDAVHAAGILARHPEIDLRKHKLGIYGKVVAADAPLAEGDRVEVYRPLALDPKEARRRRALRR